jgi:ElaA protein
VTGEKTFIPNALRLWIEARGTPAMQFHWRRFDEFGCNELYAMLAFRQDVLVVEQSSPYPDLDFVDQVADHLLATDNGSLVGYARCHAPLAGKAHASFGRIVVAQKYRGEGLGKELVGRVLARLAEGSCRDVLIGAQLHLEEFYARFGFTRDGAPYDDVGVPHVNMRLRLGHAPS